MEENNNLQSNNERNEIKSQDINENTEQTSANNIISKEEINSEKDEQKINSEKEGEENEYIFRCEKCFLIPIIKIDHTTYKIHCKCQNNHIKSDIHLSQALNEYKTLSLKTCSKCGEKSDEDNYFCIQCQQVFCIDGGCKKKHSKENPSHKLINTEQLDFTCFEHSTTISKYCKDCEKNICIKCQRTQHEGHKLIDLGEILPLNEEIENGRKLFEEKKEKLLQLKNVLNEYLQEFNRKINALLESIDAEILINKNILKNYKADLMNYQMIENFNYFSSLESMKIYSNAEFLNLINEKNWLPRTFNITQLLIKFDQPISINDEINKNESEKMLVEVKNDNPKDGSDNNLNINRFNYSDENLNINKNFSDMKRNSTVVGPFNLKNDEKIPSGSNSSKELQTIKKHSKTLVPHPSQSIIQKDFYSSLNKIKSQTIYKKTFKSKKEITENIYSALIDEKGIIFLGGDSCINIYRFDSKNSKIDYEFLVKGLDGAVNTIAELKDNYLVVGTSNNTIKIIEFMGNKKHRIHQEIRNQQKNSIYKLIEISNYYLISCDEGNITFYEPRRNNYYEICQEINLSSPTCCILQISDDIVAASHVVLNKISLYKVNRSKLELVKEIDNIELTVSNNSMAIINEDYFCSVAKQNAYIISTKNYNIEKKIDLKINITSLFPLSFNFVLFCHCKNNKDGTIDYSLSVKNFDENTKELVENEQNIIGRNKEDIDDIFYINFFNPNYMIIVTESTINIWG
jgi:hypothetical protein